MIYVMSDIHGNKNRFESIMRQINLQENDTLYILGDVIDRHPYGIELLQQIMKMPNVKMILGNHEYMMLNALDSEYCKLTLSLGHEKSLWFRNHGEVTKKAFDKLADNEKEEILNYLKSLPLNIDIELNGKKYKLVHASPAELFDENDFTYLDETEFAVWNRIRYSLQDLPYIVIFGHSTTNHYQLNNPMEIFTFQNLIGIDCGSGYPENENYGGRLACLRLDDMKAFYSEM